MNLEELQEIWLQDRLLQRLLPTPAGACALAEALVAIRNALEARNLDI